MHCCILVTNHCLCLSLLDDVKKRSLYLHTFPTAIERPTLAVIGQFFVMGATGPVFEMQTRCAAAVFKGLVRLPDHPAMQRSVEERRAMNMYQYGIDKPFVSINQFDLLHILSFTSVLPLICFWVDDWMVQNSCRSFHRASSSSGPKKKVQTEQ